MIVAIDCMRRTTCSGLFFIQDTLRNISLLKQSYRLNFRTSKKARMVAQLTY